MGKQTTHILINKFFQAEPSKLVRILVQFDSFANVTIKKKHISNQRSRISRVRQFHRSHPGQLLSESTPGQKYSLLAVFF